MKPISKALTACVAILIIGGECVAYGASLPQLPQKQVDVTMPTVTGNTYTVSSCGTLQSSINTAAAADITKTHVVNVNPSVGTCSGPITLPGRNGATGWVIIQSSNVGNLPAAGTRVTLSDVANMPTIKYGSGGNESGITTLTNAQRYRLIGIQVVQDSACSGCAQAPTNFDLVITGIANGSTNTGYIVLDRCIIRDTDSSHDSRVGVYLSGDLGNNAVIESWIDGMKSSANDTQGILVATSGGPVLIRNSYIRSAGENVMLYPGNGSTTGDASKSPHDVTVTRNTFTKDPSWVSGINFLTKTLFETKCAYRVLVEGNDFTGMNGSDGGYVMRLTARAEANASSACEVSDLTIRHNLIANNANIFSTFGSDDNTSQHTRYSKRWQIFNNLIYGLGTNCLTASPCGALYAINNGGADSASGCTDFDTACTNLDITINHNTIDNVVGFTIRSTRAGLRNLDFKDNLINDTSGYGIFNFGTPIAQTSGQAALNIIWPSSTWSFTYNTMSGLPNGGSYPTTPTYAGNSYPASFTSIQWTNVATRDYTLQSSSPAKNSASDGTDKGVNFTAYNAARAGGGGGNTGGDVTPPNAPQNVKITAP